MSLAISEFIAPQGQLEIRPGRPEDIPALSAIYRDTYGEAYPYLPTAETVCPCKGYFLTATVDGEVVGCAAGYEQAGKTYDWIEWGRLVVHKPHRGKQYGKRLNEVRRRLLQGRHSQSPARSETVCYERVNQRILSRVGFTAMGVELCKHPGLKPNVLGTQPETVLMNLLWDDGAFGGLSERPLFIPDDWVEGLELLVPVERIAQARDRARSITIPEGPVHVRSFEPRIDGPTGYVGSRLIDVDVNHPGAPEAISALRSEGFRLCALMPGVAQAQGERVADRVRLVRVLNSTIDWSLIQLEPGIQPFAQWMHEQL